MYPPPEIMILLDIYGGLLGCGKTTLIKQMLKTAYKGHKVAIIENEIGKVNIDKGEFSADDLSVRELTSGCVCCTVKGDFKEAVKVIVAEQNPEYIVLEPTGAADLSALADACLEVPQVRLNRFVMVVNAKKVKPLLAVVGEFYRLQIESADTVYLNFAGTMTKEKLEETKQILLAINPRLRFVDTPMEDIDEETFAEAVFRGSRGSAAKRAAGLLVEEAALYQPIKMGAGTSQKLYTWNYTFACEFTEEKWETLKRILESPKNSELWRAKGFLKMAGGNLKKIDLTFGDIFEEDRGETEDERAGVLVLIGRRLNVKWFRQRFEELEGEQAQNE